MVYLSWKNELDLIGLSISIVYHMLLCLLTMNHLIVVLMTYLSKNTFLENEQINKQNNSE